MNIPGDREKAELFDSVFKVNDGSELRVICNGSSLSNSSRFSFSKRSCGPWIDHVIVKYVVYDESDLKTVQVWAELSSSFKRCLDGVICSASQVIGLDKLKVAFLNRCLHLSNLGHSIRLSYEVKNPAIKKFTTLEKLLVERDLRENF